MEIARGFGLFLCKCRTGSNIAEYLALIEGLETRCLKFFLDFLAEGSIPDIHSFFIDLG